MIIQNLEVRIDPKKIKRCINSGVVFDSCVLLVLFLDKYVRKFESKKYLFKSCNIEKCQIDCLNHLMMNFRINKIIVTPHILSEFFNRIRKEFKLDYKNIEKENHKELLEMIEIYPHKNIMLNHQDFFDFGNDISLLIATEEKIKEDKYSSIVSFDGRFIRNFFEKKENILAFDLQTLQFYYK